MAAGSFGVAAAAAAAAARDVFGGVEAVVETKAFGAGE
jgi:hypothetical protein